MTRSFRIAISDDRLVRIRRQIEDFEWKDFPDAGGWKSGVGLTDLRRLVDNWIKTFDWRAQEAKLNRRQHYLTDVDGQTLHFVRARGDGSRLPILLLHGWPGSFIEFEELIDPLAEDGHDVVVPSLPGFAFSGRPDAPIGPRRTAALMDRLMRELFPGKRYIVQGGDWGSAVGAWMAHDYPDRVAALHINMMTAQADGVDPETAEEKAWGERVSKLAGEERGYFLEQSTRPQTLGIAMSDSPVGVAAWILEKFGVWADVARDDAGRPDLWAAFDEDLLLTNIMLYVAPRSFVTSTWLYRGRVLEGSHVFPAGSRVTVPTGVAAFPDPVFPLPPRALAERSYRIESWTDMERGGHFAALEQPDLLLADLRAFVENVR
ncbi:epoxide hydrolase [Sphingomonas sp. BK235]|uniref:epoxide hydrolase family protein n=1 Tax=Sphingomonas sp. BK235 TaxID=2512131 RepID=UPI00104C0200|nr:epoxide hydrolase [Sphingomonas sp. BK235]TCP31065.1 pimeloyl-ACP methyl ester carboxylesterase [Sphingomonas sp. BK235]